MNQDQAFLTAMLTGKGSLDEEALLPNCLFIDDMFLRLEGEFSWEVGEFWRELELLNWEGKVFLAITDDSLGLLEWTGALFFKILWTSSYFTAFRGESSVVVLEYIQSLDQQET